MKKVLLFVVVFIAFITSANSMSFNHQQQQNQDKQQESIANIEQEATCIEDATTICQLENCDCDLDKKTNKV